jgi:uncharacterized repeat protein (TIGR02543 family)
MAAPNGIVWGSAVGDYGRIGLYVNVTTNSNTAYAGTVDIWFWSKFSVNDTSNTLYYDNLAASGSATTNKGSLTVKTTSNSGAWSETNQIKLKSYSFSYTKGTATVKRYIYSKLANIDCVGGTMYANTTLTVPKLASYTIAYNANGGSDAPSSQTKWYGKNLTLSSTKPTRTGYTFQGWSTAKDNSVEYDAGDSYTANSGVTLYAVWKANTYTVKYDANGGTLGSVKTQTKTYGQALTLTGTATRTNYNFKGWGTSASDTTVAYAAGASYTANNAITLYAIWELAYTKPRITGLSISRCDSTGKTSDSGTYALIKFNWATDKTITSISVAWTPTTSASPTTIAASGTSGSVNTVIGNGTLSAEVTYTVTLTVEDSGGNTPVKRTLNGQAFPIDFKTGNKGVAFGKPAELDGYVDFKYKQFLRDNAEFANDKAIMGVDTDGAVYSALIPVTASGNTSLGHGLYKAGKGNTHIYGNAIQFYAKQGVYLNGNTLYTDNEKDIAGLATDGTYFSVFTPMSGAGNTAIGYDHYNKASGNTNIYGHDIIHFVSNIAEPGSYRPYRRRGDTMTLTINTAGYVTNSGTEVYFFIPLSVPLVGAPTVTLSSGDGFILRQGSKYTHGSNANVAVSPVSYTASRYLLHGIAVKATFSNTANVTNNDAIGIMWNGTITLS